MKKEGATAEAALELFGRCFFMFFLWRSKQKSQQIADSSSGHTLNVAQHVGGILRRNISFWATLILYYNPIFNTWAT